MKFPVNQISEIPGLAGVYKFVDKNRILLYIGKAKNLKKRISSYFINETKELKTQKLISQINQIEVIPVASEFEALLLEASLIKKFQPKYNIIWKDDKHYIYIKITREIFPRILLARKNDNKKSTYYGPFPSAKTAREILSYIREIFPFCQQNPKAKKACFYSHLELCNPCPAEIKTHNSEKYHKLQLLYKKNNFNIKKILSGEIKHVRRKLTNKMNIYSIQREFEQAALVRDKIGKLDMLVNNYSTIDSYLSNADLTYQNWQNEQLELSKLLSNYFPLLNLLKKIECYDVSNIYGKLAVGSMVTFTEGQPNKSLYRRFKIKMEGKPDDNRMLAEVFKRRLNHLEWKLPDLFVVDGGKPQISTIDKLLLTLNVHLPLIGLAKKNEEIIIPCKSKLIHLRLERNSRALHLIQRLRDEAHRFAHKYHSMLRLKYLLNSI